MLQVWSQLKQNECFCRYLKFLRLSKWEKKKYFKNSFKNFKNFNLYFSKSNHIYSGSLPMDKPNFVWIHWIVLLLECQQINRTKAPTAPPPLKDNKTKLQTCSFDSNHWTTQDHLLRSVSLYSLKIWVMSSTLQSSMSQWFPSFFGSWSHFHITAFWQPQTFTMETFISWRCPGGDMWAEKTFHSLLGLVFWLWLCLNRLKCSNICGHMIRSRYWLYPAFYLNLNCIRIFFAVFIIIKYFIRILYVN